MKNRLSIEIVADNIAAEMRARWCIVGWLLLALVVEPLVEWLL